MRKFQNAFFVYVVLTIQISCNGPTMVRPPKTEQKEETPKALQENSLDVVSKSYRTNDLVQELFQELVEKNETLKKLEESISNCQSKPSSVKQDFETYNSKSTNFYNSAENCAANISDSQTKKLILKFISNSELNYQNGTNDFKNLIDQISKNGTKMEDKHNILKIVLTMAEMEKYQKSSRPSKKPLQELIQEQEKTMKQIENSTPKH